MKDSRRASDYGTLTEMVVDLAGGREALGEFDHSLLLEFSGFCNVGRQPRCKAIAARHGYTRSGCWMRVHKIRKVVFARPLSRPLRDFVAFARKTFSADNWRIRRGDLGRRFDAAFGWRGTTDYSVVRLLRNCGVPVAHTMAEHRWNENGMAGKMPPRPPEMAASHKAVFAVLAKAGKRGMSVDEIVAACQKRFPTAAVTIRDAISAVSYSRLKAGRKGDGAFAFPLFRGVRGRKARYAMSSAFADPDTALGLRSAAETLRDRLSSSPGGKLDVVDVWPAISGRLAGFPAPCGFYLLLRGLKPRGLSLQRYPWVETPSPRSRADRTGNLPKKVTGKISK